MKSKAFMVVTVLSAGLVLSGCDQIKKLTGGGAPKGQVVATVDGKEITNLELRGEMGGFGSRDPAVMKAAQQQALQQIIMRRLLAEEARKEKLDKSADYTLQVARGEEALLAQLYQRKLATKATAPTKQEAETFVSSNPQMFANRRVLLVDQVIARPNKIDPDHFRPLTTLDQVKALLDAEGVQYQTSAATIDTLSADPRLMDGISKLPPGEVFVIPQNGSLLFNRIQSATAAPFVGEMATAYATNALRQRRAQESVAKSMTDLRKAAESKIIYNPAFKPPPEKPAAKTAAAKVVPDAIAPGGAVPVAAPAVPAAK